MKVERVLPLSSSKYNVYHPFPISEHTQLYKSRTLKQLVEEVRWEVTPLLTKSYSWSSFTSPVPPRFFLTSILLPSYLWKRSSFTAMTVADVIDTRSRFSNENLVSSFYEMHPTALLCRSDHTNITIHRT